MAYIVVACLNRQGKNHQDLVRGAALPVIDPIWQFRKGQAVGHISYGILVMAYWLWQIRKGQAVGCVENSGQNYIVMA